MAELTFPEPPRADTPVGPGEDFRQVVDDLRRENAAISAERDRALAEANRLREERDARGLRKVAGWIAEGIGFAVALTLTFAVLVGIVAGIAWLVGWRP